MHYKHLKEETGGIKKILKNVFFIALLIATILACGTIIYAKYNEIQLEKDILEKTEYKEQQIEVIENMQEEIPNEKLSTLQVVEVDMPEKMGDYEVLGEIEIPKIKVKKYILDYCTDESLNLAVARFWDEGNQGLHKAGNFSIIGHNYKGIFKELRKLEIKDTFILTDRNGKTCNYEIYDIYVVEPDDVSCIEDTLEGKREVTLITCTPGGEKRLVIKAKEQEIREEENNEKIN